MKTMKNKTPQTICAILVLLAGFAAGLAWAADTISQAIPITVQSGGSGSGCPGTWTGYAKMTNAAGTFFITPPTNATSGTFTDVSGFAQPYASVACVKQNDLVTWCGTNSVTFPATSSNTYLLTVYVKSPVPPPTNGQPINVQITWQ